MHIFKQIILKLYIMFDFFETQQDDDSSRFVRKNSSSIGLFLWISTDTKAFSSKIYNNAELSHPVEDSTCFYKIRPSSVSLFLFFRGHFFVRE